MDVPEEELQNLRETTTRLLSRRLLVKFTFSWDRGRSMSARLVLFVLKGLIHGVSLQDYNQASG